MRRIRCDALGVMLGAIPAMHGAQDAVGTRLQRDVKMARDALRRSDERDEIFGDVLRLDRAEAELFERGFVENAADNIGERRARDKIAAIAAEVDAAEHDFLARRLSHSARTSRTTSSRRQAAAPSANERDHAVANSDCCSRPGFSGWGACGRAC